MSSLGWSHEKRVRAVLGFASLCLMTAGCATADLREINRPVPAKLPWADMPYQVMGVTYYPLKDAAGFTEEGVASWYGPNFHGKLTSNKEVYNMNAMTAAHRTLPFNTWVKVINLENGKETTVRINDRGPFAKERIIDLSYKAARKLGIVGNGTASVKLVAIGPGKDGETVPSPVPVSYTYNRVSADASDLPREAYAIQVAVFKDPDNAAQLGRQINRGRVKSFDLQGEKYYRVVTGNFADFDSALKHRDQVRQQGYPKAFVIPENY
ncbi:MAG: septal ring lytic transglycosylase RlpA family protein [Nitrospinae bacterium]|nr:septal ring lytic transglycosylase RlpA family protein [Nitrospinota bacterium]